MHNKVVAKAILQAPNGDMLLLRRSDTDTRRPGEWDLPGGGVEFGELINNCVAREIQEEAGIDIAPSALELVYARTEAHEHANELVTKLLFKGKVTNMVIELSDEHSDAKWVDVDTALSEFPHPFYGPGIAQARDAGLLD